ncbi:hypothetical protein BgiMline_021701, partial [Biomphalaria glabrata]
MRNMTPCPPSIEDVFLVCTTVIATNPQWKDSTKNRRSARTKPSVSAGSFSNAQVLPR